MRTFLDEILEAGSLKALPRFARGFNKYEKFELENEFNPNNGNTYQSFANEIVRLANQEKGKWGNGAVKETHAGIYNTLKDYWKTGVNLSENAAAGMISDRTPWSAAFISWVMKNAGAGKYFNYSSAHWKYISQAKIGRMNNDYNMVYWLYRLSERAPRVGDLICTNRENSGLNYDNAHEQKYRAAHCDIITQVLPDRIIAVGGNKSDSVTQTTFLLTSNGFFDTTRYGTTYFGLMSMW